MKNGDAPRRCLSHRDAGGDDGGRAGGARLNRRPGRRAPRPGERRAHRWRAPHPPNDGFAHIVAKCCKMLKMLQVRRRRARLARAALSMRLGAPTAAATRPHATTCLHLTPRVCHTHSCIWLPHTPCHTRDRTTFVRFGGPNDRSGGLYDRSGGLYALPRPAETYVPRHVCRDADWREPVTVSTLLDVTLG